MSLAAFGDGCHPSKKGTGRQASLSGMVTVLGLWIGGFLTGASLGRVGVIEDFVAATHAPWAFVGVVLGLALTKAHLAAACMVFGISGFIWGVHHAAPQACASGRGKVVRAPSWVQASGTYIVATSQGRRETQGVSLEVEERGTIERFGGRRLLTTCRSRLRVDPAPRQRDPSLLGLIRSSFDAGTHDWLERFPEVRRPWIRGLLFGQQSTLSEEVADAFRHLGLLHLLVVSGMHITLVAWLVERVTALPWILSYSLRLLGPRAYFVMLGVPRVLSMLLVAIYSVCVGLSQASLRALLVYGVWRFWRGLDGTVPLGQRLLIAATVQTWVAPLGFLSESTLLSWGAYLLVLRPDPVAGGALCLVSRAVWTQSQLAVLSGVVLGTVPVLGILANLLIVPLFPIAFGALVIILLTGSWAPRLEQVCWTIQDLIIKLVMVLEEVGQGMPGAWIHLERHHPGWLLIVGMCSCFFVLNALANLPITSPGVLGLVPAPRAENPSDGSRLSRTDSTPGG